MGSGGLIVMDETSCIPDVAKFFMEFCMDESCGKCGPCRGGTVQMLRMLEKITDGTADKGTIPKARGTVPHGEGSQPVWSGTDLLPTPSTVRSATSAMSMRRTSWIIIVRLGSVRFRKNHNRAE